MATMTEQEKIDWDNLYQYVRKLLGYDETMALPKFMVVRLKGLTEGKFIANNRTKPMAQYSFNTVYLTFVYCKNEIQRVLQTKSFKNEQHKFNYIMAIVENNINDVVIKLRNAKKSKEVAERQIQKIDIDIPTVLVGNNNGSNTTNTDDNLNSKFNDLTKEMW